MFGVEREVPMNSNATKIRQVGRLAAMMPAIAGDCCSGTWHEGGAPLSRPPAEVGMNKNGFSLVEILIGLVIIGILSVVVVGKINGAQSAATTMKCLADINAFAADVDALSPTGDAPTQEQVRQHIDWQGKYKDYWYIPNNTDFINGHGNDLDGCDEENPGQSLPGRECIPMRFLFVCMHDTHGSSSDAKYCFHIGDARPAQIVGYDEHQRTYLEDGNWWDGEDPGFDDWIGLVPKNN